jgi:excisionase family DNA binding protein
VTAIERKQEQVHGDSTVARVEINLRRSEPTPLERLLTVHELAALLQLHAKTVERMARDGRLPGVRVTGRQIQAQPSSLVAGGSEDRMPRF